MEINYKKNTSIEDKDLKTLYKNAGWDIYIQNMKKLQRAIKNSLCVITAWNNENLVGLIRVVGDGETIIYIQDILVLNNYKRNKIGSNLIKKVLEEFKNVRQKVLLTDDLKSTRGFYESLGFVSCDKGNLVAFANFS